MYGGDQLEKVGFNGYLVTLLDVCSVCHHSQDAGTVDSFSTTANINTRSLRYDNNGNNTYNHNNYVF